VGRTSLDLVAAASRTLLPNDEENSEDTEDAYNGGHFEIPRRLAMSGRSARRRRLRRSVGRAQTDPCRAGVDTSTMRLAIALDEGRRARAVARATRLVGVGEWIDKPNVRRFGIRRVVASAVA
jgi:hypothetical protein